MKKRVKEGKPWRDQKGKLIYPTHETSEPRKIKSQTNVFREDVQLFTSPVISRVIKTVRFTILC